MTAYCVSMETFKLHPWFRNQLIGSRGTILSNIYGKQRPKITRVDPKSGYIVANMPPTEGHSVRQYVHRLVAQAHVANPDGLDEVHHLDHDKANNSAENLQWISHRDNILAARKHHGNWTKSEGRPLIETPIDGSPARTWANAKTWATTTGNCNPHRSANVSTAIRSKRAAYGSFWAFA